MPTAGSAHRAALVLASKPDRRLAGDASEQRLL
jgi:hypothetical protein